MISSVPIFLSQSYNAKRSVQYCFISQRLLYILYIWRLYCTTSQILETILYNEPDLGDYPVQRARSWMTILYNEPYLGDYPVQRARSWRLSCTTSHILETILYNDPDLGDYPVQRPRSWRLSCTTRQILGTILYNHSYFGDYPVQRV